MLPSIEPRPVKFSELYGARLNFAVYLFTDFVIFTNLYFLSDLRAPNRCTPPRQPRVGGVGEAGRYNPTRKIGAGLQQYSFRFPACLASQAKRVRIDPCY